MSILTQGKNVLKPIKKKKTRQPIQRTQTDIKLTIKFEPVSSIIQTQIKTPTKKNLTNANLARQQKAQLKKQKEIQLGKARAIKGIKGSQKIQQITSKTRSLFGFNQRGFIKSSNIHAVSYDVATKIMIIEFESKAVYEFYDIPYDIYMDILTGNEAARTLDRQKPIRFWPGKYPSAGAAFYWEVRVKGYRYKRIK